MTKQLKLDSIYLRHEICPSNRGNDEIISNNYSFNYKDSYIHIYKKSAPKMVRLDIFNFKVARIELINYDKIYDKYIHYTLPINSYYYLTQDLFIVKYGPTAPLVAIDIASNHLINDKPRPFPLTISSPITNVLDLEKIPWN